MRKETISFVEGFSMLTLFIMGSTLILGAAPEAKRDKWIAIIIATLVSIIIVSAYSKIATTFPGKTIFDIFELLLGKIFGKILTILYIWYFLHLGSLVMRNFGEFMNVLAMPETPIFISIICIGVLCIWVVKSGIEVLARTSKVLFITCIAVIIIIQFCTIPILDISNIKPIVENGWIPIIDGAFSTISFPYAESIVFMGALYCIEKKNLVYKVYISSVIIAGIFILVIALRNLFVLGESVVEGLYFPAYLAVSKINIGDFIQRVEGSVSIVFAAGVFVKISLCLLAASNGIAKLFNLKDYRSVVIQTGLIMSYLAYFVYDSIMEMSYWATKIYKYYAFPFQIIIPLIMLIVIEIKVKRNKHKTK